MIDPTNAKRASLSIPAPLILSPNLGFWGEGKGLYRQAQEGLAVNLEGGKAVLGRLREVLGRVNRGSGEAKIRCFCLKSIGYITNIYIGELREGI